MTTEKLEVVCEKCGHYLDEVRPLCMCWSNADYSRGVISAFHVFHMDTKSHLEASPIDSEWECGARALLSWIAADELTSNFSDFIEGLAAARIKVTSAARKHLAEITGRNFEEVDREFAKHGA